MKNQRRGRRHFKLKASAGAFSGRFGPQKVSPPKPLGATDPWIKDWAGSGLPAVIPPPIRTVVRRP